MRNESNTFIDQDKSGERLMEHEINYLRDLQFKQECILKGCIPYCLVSRGERVWFHVCQEGEGYPVHVHRGLSVCPWGSSADVQNF